MDRQWRQTWLSGQTRLSCRTVLRAMAQRGGAGTIVAPERIETTDPDEVTEPDRPWIVIVWNDPINLMSYVRYIFQKLFGYPREEAHRLMMQVHVEGKSVVWSGPRERCEAYVSALHSYGLWATMQKDD